MGAPESEATEAGTGGDGGGSELMDSLEQIQQMLDSVPAGMGANPEIESLLGQVRELTSSLASDASSSRSSVASAPIKGGDDTAMYQRMTTLVKQELLGQFRPEF